MAQIIDLISKNASGLLLYVVIFAIGSSVLFFLSKLKTESGIALQTLIVIKAILSRQIGSKAGDIVDIWIEGLKKIEDGEFSREDGVDQFIRFVRLGAATRGIELSELELNAVTSLVESTLNIFVGKKPKEITMAVHQFTVMNKK
jgi:hypothetical protein